MGTIVVLRVELFVLPAHPEHSVCPEVQSQYLVHQIHLHHHRGQVLVHNVPRGCMPPILDLRHVSPVHRGCSVQVAVYFLHYVLLGHLLWVVSQRVVFVVLGITAPPPEFKLRVVQGVTVPRPDSVLACYAPLEHSILRQLPLVQHYLVHAHHVCPERMEVP